ncbi:MAG: 50S ribosomal protein L3 [Candidatus Harrisonbacteria bacterium]|nr:50S ribosomal protein L3 [Candidatus Harrisonbacteria bacterium]MBI2604126.1 50S ribosomal protein L3 [Candidatus Harrisonbacteria bacterium]
MKVKGKKLHMTQIWKNDVVVPVSVIEAEKDSDLTGFAVGDLVKVAGITKSHGFQGVVKRHGFSGGPKTHGQKNRLRAPGSIGNTSPQRIIPGRRMAGRTGGVRKTVKNLVLVEIDAPGRIMKIRGAVPGYNKRSILEITK